MSRPLRTVYLPSWATFETLPQDKGQTVEVSYATDGEDVIRRVTDRSEPSAPPSYARRAISRRADIEADYDPANGHLPRLVGRWQPVAVRHED